ncbi:MAG: SRPBCC domain-containing protein [Actinomycetota bacterium]
MGKPFEIRKEIPLEATPQQVWEAIATGPGLAAWFMPMELDLDSPTVTSNEPGRRLAVRLPANPDGSFHSFDYRIEPAGRAGAVFRFRHSGFTSDDWGEEFEAVTSAGWDMYLHTLSQYLAHFAGRPAHYVEAEAPPASADEAAWPRLLAAMGLSQPVKEGTGLRFDVPRLGAVEGVVDYVSPTFVGLRAPAALIRFHGRGRIGLPVAVSMHIYVSTSYDVEGAQRAWESWLADVFA